MSKASLSETAGSAEPGLAELTGDSALRDSALRDSIQQIFAQRHRAGVAPASSFAIGFRGQDWLAANFGTLDPLGTAPDSDSAYRIASCTKSFTAALILQMRDAGQLGLDDLVSLHVPEVGGWELPSEHSAQLTLRMLLTMSAGLATDNQWGDRQESLSSAEFSALLGQGVNFVSEPGTAFEYSNLGYAILGRVAENIGGADYCSLLRQRILEPLGLTGTDWEAPAGSAAVVGFAPCGITPGGSPNGPEFEPLETTGPGAFSAIGGLWSSLRDLNRWAWWLSSAFAEEPWGNEVLSAASRREMQQLQRVIVDPLAEGVRGYGLGLFVEHHPKYGHVVSHSGGYPGFSSHMRWQTSSGWHGVAFENATYAVVQRPLLAALEQVFETSGPAVEPWPETILAATRVNELLHAWSLGEAAFGSPEKDDGGNPTHHANPGGALFSPNVGQDVAWEVRLAELSELQALTGPLNFAAVSWRNSATPAHRSWDIPGPDAELHCEIVLHPMRPSLIQKFDVSVVPYD